MVGNILIIIVGIIFLVYIGVLLVNIIIGIIDYHREKKALKEEEKNDEETKSIYK